MVVGARAVGKTTAARQFAKTVVRLDRADEAAIYAADPDAALSAEAEPVLLDEWQEVPGVLAAVKRAVDDDRRPGRFVLAGSVRADLEASSWPGTGRVVRVPIYGLTVGECHGRPGAGLDFVAAVRDGDPTQIPLPEQMPDVLGYVDLACRGGFPVPALSDDEPFRRRWLASYVGELVTRDLVRLGERRDPVRLRRYLRAAALHPASVVQQQTLVDLAGVDHKTTAAYDRVLESLFVFEEVPAWHSRRLPRLAKAGKRYALDSSLAMPAAGISRDTLLRDAVLLGRIIETFVIAQLRPLLAVRDDEPSLHHVRQRDGRHEIDVLVEFGDGRILALEIKAAASVGVRDARHIVWLRDELGDRFAGGAVLHTGRRPYRIADDVLAVPIAALWG